MLARLALFSQALAWGLALLLAVTAPVQAGFDIVYEWVEEDEFDDEARAHLSDALDDVERLWEGIILGYEPQELSVTFDIQVGPTNEVIAAGGSTEFISVGRFTLPKAGTVLVNPDWVVLGTNGFGIAAAAGVNLLDDLLAHEIGHALGIGELWEENNAYVVGSGQYTGAFGLEAYRAEFDPEASFIPVELAGGEGTANAHWDQLMRSSSEEGDPSNPWVLSPFVEITDARGRDLGQELMSGALDPDYGEPFLSNTTVQSLRDLGYAVIPQFPLPADRNADGATNVADLDHLTKQLREHSDDLFFDINGDGVFNLDDRTALITLLDTLPGDSNYDHRFDSSDLVTAFQFGEYEDGIQQNSNWSGGDWTGDAEFDTADLIHAFQSGSFESATVPHAVPEPQAAMLLVIALLISGARPLR